MKTTTRSTMPASFGADGTYVGTPGNCIAFVQTVNELKRPIYATNHRLYGGAR